MSDGPPSPFGFPCSGTEPDAGRTQFECTLHRLVKCQVEVNWRGTSLAVIHPADSPKVQVIAFVEQRRKADRCTRMIRDRGFCMWGNVLAQCTPERRRMMEVLLAVFRVSIVVEAF